MLDDSLNRYGHQKESEREELQKRLDGWLNRTRRDLDKHQKMIDDSLNPQRHQKDGVREKHQKMLDDALKRKGHQKKGNLENHQKRLAQPQGAPERSRS